MNRVVFIIPGLSHSTREKRYRQIGDFFRMEGIEPVFVDVKWKRKVISQIAECFIKKYRARKAERKYILGFSFGAMVAFIAAARLRPDALVLCSLSPYFAEDLPQIEESWLKDLGKRRVNDFRKLYANKLAGDIRCPTFLVAGEFEPEILKRRAEEVYRRLGCPKKILYINAKHDIAHGDYPETIRKIAADVKKSHH